MKSTDLLLLDRVLERSMGLRMTGLDDVIYVRTPEDLPHIGSGTVNLRGMRSLPACLQIAKNGQRVIYIALEQSSIVDSEPILLGEVKV